MILSISQGNLQDQRLTNNLYMVITLCHKKPRSYYAGIMLRFTPTYSWIKLA